MIITPSSAQRVGYVYTGFGTLYQLSRPISGSNYTCLYDILDRLTSWEDPLGKITTSSFSPFCNQTTVTTPTGIQNVTTQDSLCRLASEQTQSELHSYS